MKKLIALIALWLVAVPGMAQAASHSVTLTWTDASNPAGTTYNVYRAPGLCSGTPAFSKVGSAVAGKTYTDTTVTVGNYCFQVTAVFSGAESVPSNLVNPNVPAFAPTTLTFTVQ